jgi:hypothetical protein
MLAISRATLSQQGASAPRRQQSFVKQYPQCAEPSALLRSGGDGGNRASGVSENRIIIPVHPASDLRDGLIGHAEPSPGDVLVHCPRRYSEFEMLKLRSVFDLAAIIVRRFRIDGKWASVKCFTLLQIYFQRTRSNAAPNKIG